MNATTIPIMGKRTPTSFRLTDGARELLEELSDDLGVSQAAVIEMSIRSFAATRGKVPSGRPRTTGDPAARERRDHDDAD